MDKAFREYHKFTEKELKALWKDCIFVFDTNTLLNMYRYSRETVESYFKVLGELKNKNQLWLPHQVGFEFHENRIGVICEYEKSYDSILELLEKAKNDVEKKYRNHPFLDLEQITKEMESGLTGVKKEVLKAQKKHPKWLTNDDVLTNIMELYLDSVGKPFSEERIFAIYKEGEDRYERKVPPGFKDSKKPENKKYGDLIMWYQIIEKAKETNKPIILISGDVKEDWWLQKDGERLMPLPQLKKEMYEEADVDFHIYTADSFLEHYLKGTKDKDKVKTISEVKRIRELSEERVRHSKKFIDSPGYFAKLFDEYQRVVSRIIKLLEDDLDVENLNHASLFNLRLQLERFGALENSHTYDEFGPASFAIILSYGLQLEVALKDILSNKIVSADKFRIYRMLYSRIRILNNKLKHSATE